MNTKSKKYKVVDKLRNTVFETNSILELYGYGQKNAIDIKYVRVNDLIVYGWDELELF